MSWTDNLALTMGTLVIWGFLMASLFNIFLRVISIKKDNYLVFISIVMFLSYYFSDLFHDLDAGAEIYLTWFYYDIITIFFVLLPIVFRKVRFNLGAAPVYIYLGLTLNAFLFISMYIDIQILSNSEHWILWDVYMFSVNVIDYGMIITLIIGRDWLGLVLFTRFIRKAIAKKERFIEKQKEKRLSQAMLQA